MYEASHIRSSIPHPQTYFRKNLIASRLILPWLKYNYTRYVIFGKQDLHSDEFRSRNPVIRQTFRWKYVTSTVARVSTPLPPPLPLSPTQQASCTSTLQTWPPAEIITPTSTPPSSPRSLPPPRPLLRCHELQLLRPGTGLPGLR